MISAGGFTGYLKAGDNTVSEFWFLYSAEDEKRDSRNLLLVISEPHELRSAHFPPPVPDLVEKARKISEHSMCA